MTILHDNRPFVECDHADHPCPACDGSGLVAADWQPDAADDAFAAGWSRGWADFSADRPDASEAPADWPESLRVEWRIGYHAGRNAWWGEVARQTRAVLDRVRCEPPDWHESELARCGYGGHPSEE
jgi:hypothetical protein